jgi:shikimate dehydrogenase
MMSRYGLLGRKLSHSYSPKIHKLLWDCENYTLIEKEPQELASFFADRDFDGINVTIPYKKTVMEFLDGISDTAASVGCVNTVTRRRDGTLWGDNTDVFGFEYMLRSLGTEVRGSKCIVLGSGGASQTVCFVLERMGASCVHVISRSGEDNYENISKHYDADIIVNATPVGMFPSNGECPVVLDSFINCKAVLDLIYNPSKTKLLLDAERLGIPFGNGLSMLVAQAMRAAQIWGRDELGKSDICNTLAAMERDMRNIVLIGMPGCGKSTVGRKVAKLSGREFVDCDTEIEKIADKSIPEIFSESGEEEFRRIESEVIADISKRSGLVIASGGGVVTRECNRDMLRQNSTVVFINRDIKDLPSNGRPISQSRRIEDIAEERMPLYRSWCDFEVQSIGIAGTAKQILKELGYEITDN